MTMHTTLREWIVAVMLAHLPLLRLAFAQRAKFEGWLKFELACEAVKRHAKHVEVEKEYRSRTGGRQRSDLYFVYEGQQYHLELKTPNTNWGMPGVEQVHRPISRNIASVIEDARKLRGTKGKGLIGFVLFPVPPGDRQWHVYLERISLKLGISLTEQDHCTRIQIPLGDSVAEGVVCCFSVTGGAE